ncbi:NFACT family protein [Sporomusa aerivorans]|uniref:Rqc2 family fibronectin-binding protein n=1 Tax=Sporomusa aerivorans TaxID=204936 RepID=UPI00352AC094
MNIDGLSLAPLVHELNRALTGGRIDKVFQPDSYSLLLWVRQPGENLRLYISANPERPKLLLTIDTPENPAVAPNFCMLLRKHLEDGRIAGIEQHSLDRIVNINIDVRGERGIIITKRLIIEIMGKHSNIILTQDNVITDAIRRVGFQLSRHRQVLPGKEYIYPPGQDRINILSAKPAAFAEQLLASPPDMPLLKAIIAAGIGLGPLSAKEIIWRAGFSPDILLGNLDITDFDALAEAVASISQPLVDGQVVATVVVEGADRPLALAAFKPEHLGHHTFQFFPTMSAAVAFFDSFKGRPPLPEKELLTKLVAAELSKLTRKETVLTEELSQAENADLLRKYGDILMANLYNLAPGSSEEVLADIFSEQPGALVAIRLEPLLSPLENAQQYYAKYNKAKRAAEHLACQLAECQQGITYLESIAVALYHAETGADVNEIKQELIDAGYIKAAGKRRLPAAQSAPLSFKTTDGFIISIGRNNRQNDWVTFKQAGPDDLWLHTKDIPGSHVIIRRDNRDISEQAIHEAAQLAAHFSKARQSANVPVDYTRRRHVRKPSGAKPGFVIYDHQNTVYVTPDTGMVANLLTLR